MAATIVFSSKRVLDMICQLNGLKQKLASAANIGVYPLPLFSKAHQGWGMTQLFLKIKFTHTCNLNKPSKPTCAYLSN